MRLVSIRKADNLQEIVKPCDLKQDATVDRSTCEVPGKNTVDELLAQLQKKTEAEQEQSTLDWESATFHHAARVERSYGLLSLTEEMRAQFFTETNSLSESE